jgi:hypothetical protein
MQRMWLLRLLLIGVLLAAGVLPVAAERAYQSPFTGQIISPPPGSEIRGSVQIVGIANHPNFWKYDIYLLTGRAEDEWIPVVAGVQQKVESPAQLAVWDSTQVPDGEYILLLRVWDNSQGLQDFEFSPYNVANTRPADTPTPVATDTPLPPLPTVRPQTPTVVFDQPPTSTPRATATPGGPATVTPTSEPSALSSLKLDDWQDAFCSGAWLAAMLFGLWGIVWIIRQGVRWVVRRQWRKRFFPPQ